IATFSDANPGGSLADFTDVSINWGDGQTTPGTVQVAQGGGFQVLGNHVYANAGTWSVLVSITDKGGSSTTATSTVTTAVPEGQDYALALIVPAPAASGGSASAGTVYAALVNWGDGNTTSDAIVSPVDNGT